MIALIPDLFVVVKEMSGERAPQPRPLSSGFGHGTAYRVLGVHSPSETSEAYFILSNDRDEVWFISNRHLRTYALVPSTSALRVPVMSGDGQATELPELAEAALAATYQHDGDRRFGMGGSL